MAGDSFKGLARHVLLVVTVSYAFRRRDEGYVLRGRRLRTGHGRGHTPDIVYPDPVQTVLLSRRPTKGRIERAFRKLDTDARNATYQSDIDHAKERNEQLYRRVLSSKWAAVGESEYRRVSETIRKRYDKLREKSSKTKVGIGGSVPGVGSLGVSGEKQTTKEPPPE